MRLLAWISIIFNIHNVPKEEKIKIYQIVIDKIKNRPDPWTSGLCLYLSIEYKRYYDLDDLYKFFPEVYIQKPFKTLNEAYWFERHSEKGKQKRISILEKAIKRLSK